MISIKPFVVGLLCLLSTPTFANTDNAAELHNVIRDAVSQQSTLTNLGSSLNQSYDFSQQAKPETPLPAMQNDQTLQASAASYASECRFAHSGSSNGENLFVGTGNSWALEHATNSWADEARHYDYDTRSCGAGEQCGHYTQMVWDSTNKVGCAIQVCDSVVDSAGSPIFGGQTSTMIICHYSPPGNYVGQFPYVKATVTNDDPPTANPDGDGSDDTTSNPTNNPTDTLNYTLPDNEGEIIFSNGNQAIQQNLATQTMPATVPDGIQLPYGTFQYDITTDAGAAVDIVVTAPYAAIMGYLLQSNTGDWIQQQATVTNQDGQTRVEFTVTEGGEFDRDGIADGVFQLAWGGVASTSSFSIWPSSYLFGGVELGSASRAVEFTLENTGSRVLSVQSASVVGQLAASFEIVDDLCSNQILSTGQRCTVSARFAPSSTGSKTALLQFETDDPDTAMAAVFLSNHEAPQEESSRRLPPVLNHLVILDSNENPVDDLKANTEYTFEWSILGYHAGYSSIVALFDCTDISDGVSCGASYNDESRLTTSGQLSPDIISNGAWTHQGERSRVFTYSYKFTTPDVTSDMPIVIRFYRLNNQDGDRGSSSLSLVIPGNHAPSYYDTTGRRLQKLITP